MNIPEALFQRTMVPGLARHLNFVILFSFMMMAQLKSLVSKSLQCYHSLMHIFTLYILDSSAPGPSGYPEKLRQYYSVRYNVNHTCSILTTFQCQSETSPGNSFDLG